MVNIYYQMCSDNRYDVLHSLAYRLLSEVMQKYYGVMHYTLGKNEYGKPYFLDCPYHFSITHTNFLVAIAVSDTPIGIDCERADVVVSERVGKRILKNGSA